ncbi:MAG: class I SAM-dependent methyltransferase [Bacteroidota bacterium]
MSDRALSPAAPRKPTGKPGDGPHDGYSFEALARSYNFLKISSFGRVLCNLVMDECQQRGTTPRVLDVGCGFGIARRTYFQHEIRAHCGEFWGIEPDESVTPEDGLFDHFQHALMETATLPENNFDVAYSSMVMEHVADPEAFLAAVARCLKPGGTYLFLTPNAKCFIPWAAKVCHKLGIDDAVLRLVKPAEAIEEYHYPVQYRFNTEAEVDAYATQHGFLSPEYVYIEGPAMRNYLPGPLRPIYSAIAWKHRTFPNPRSLVTMIGRLTKAG